ncbi:MAG: methyltransferase regulatory domain-containing protein [Myxococcota bacterium]
MSESDEWAHYRRLPYQGRAHFPSHVDFLATIPALFGLAPPDPRQSRVLEIGCADGTNLITMAYHLPDSEFVGFDAVDTHIQSGQQMIADLTLDNVTLLQQDLRTITADLGTFDYIIAHGVFSWIDEAAQTSLLTLIGQRLRPDGIAYVSYNCYPGWHFDEHLRGMMRYHTQGLSSAKDEVDQARAILQFVQHAIPDKASIRHQYLDEMNRKLVDYSDDYIYHEYLEPENRPLYFSDFMTRADAAGLQYVGETSFPSMLSLTYPEDVQKTLDQLGRTILEFEQYRDFVCNRRFRNTLLTHKGMPISRSVGLQPILSFRIGFPLQPDHESADGILNFGKEGDPETMVSVTSPLHKAALRLLASRWPAAVPFADVVAHGIEQTGRAPDALLQTELADLLMKLYSQGLCEFHTIQPPLTNQISERPQVSRLARYQAFSDRILSSQRHEMFGVNPLERVVVAQMNGQRSRDDLVAHLAGMIQTRDNPELAGMTPEDVAAQLVDRLLGRLAKNGMLLPPGAEPLNRG